MSDQREPLGNGELKNNNQRGDKLGVGDANANNLQTDDGGRTGGLGSLSGLMTETTEEDKVIIWGTDSQLDDPELAEFEMLECQELEAYLVEEGEEFVELAEQMGVQEQLSLGSRATAEQKADYSSQEETKFIQQAGIEQEPTVSCISEDREASRTELSSETDVFVTCLSTISSTATTTQMTDSCHNAFGSHSVVAEDLTQASQICSPDSERVKSSQKEDDPSFLPSKSTLHQKALDMNLNSVLCSEDVASHIHLNNGGVCKDVSDEHKKHNTQKNPAESSMSDCTFKALSTVAKSQEEGNIKMDKSTQADEIPDLIKPVQTSTKGTPSANEHKAIRKQGSFENTPTKQNSFDKSFKKQPSFDNTLKKQFSFDNSLKRQGSFENTVNSRSSSLERRKPWGSPSRTATTASPKTTSCSPKRHPPASPAKAHGTRSLSFERSDSSLRSQSLKPPNKININSGIPKPITPQQKEIEPRKSSPPQKPKNVRPKIITYVRKNVPAKPQDSQHEAPTPPPRLSSYSSLPVHKDLKCVPQSKSTPVLSCSNLLVDKYRQEMQKAVFYPLGTFVIGAKPPGSTIPQRLSGKSESFHEEMSKKYLQEVRSELRI